MGTGGQPIPPPEKKNHFLASGRGPEIGIIRVFCVRRINRGLIFFSIVLSLRIRAFLGIKGDQFFLDFRFFLALILHTNWCTTICITCPILRKIIRFLRKIECIKFVCNKFVLVLVQIDLIQFENLNCIRSI